MMEGYYGRERHETFEPDGWYATGDIFSRDANGFFYFTGRRSEMIKTAGANVSPREVEEAIHDLTGLQAHVVGLEDADRGQLVAAAVVAADPSTLNESDLRARLGQRLSTYKVPKRIRVVTGEQLPIMSSGKLDLPGLRDLLK
jgi:acyl-CoA synthetase (AMP-forming)/AMP-acid ligase II